MDRVLSFQAKLTQKKELASDIYHMCYKPDRDIEFRAGQFMTFLFNGENRVYSIASSPSQKSKLEFTIRLIKNGFASEIFRKTTVGDTQKMLGPAGVFTLGDTDTPKIFLATGIGIAPFRSMIQYMFETKFSHQFILFWGNRYKRDIIFHHEWEEIHLENAYFDYTFCISRENINKEHFCHGHVQECLKTYIEQHKLDKNMFEYYICGGGDNVKSIVNFLKSDLTIDADSIFSEHFF